jgi:N12 class adenine-specific DNA methylase
MKLYEHQKQAIKLTADLNHVAYYHDMGLGKTFTGSEKIHELGAK